MKRDCLEAEFGEEPLVLSHLVTLFQLVLDLLARLLPQSRVAEAVLVDLTYKRRLEISEFLYFLARLSGTK